MGPVSDIGFSVWGWGAIRGAGLGGGGGRPAPAPRALGWGWGAGARQGSMGISMSTPILPTLLAWLGSRAGCPRSRTIAIHIGHGNGMAWQQGREGSVYPVAPLLGLGRRAAAAG